MEHTKGEWECRQKRGNNQYEYLLEINNGQNVVAEIEFMRKGDAQANARLIAAAPKLDAYRQYVEDNLERIERGGWTPICFAEFCDSEECEIYLQS